MGRAPLRGNTKLVSVDFATLEQATITARPGIKSFPAVLNDGEIAYVRKDCDSRGIFYNSTEKEGPLGMIRTRYELYFFSAMAVAPIAPLAGHSSCV